MSAEIPSQVDLQVHQSEPAHLGAAPGEAYLAKASPAYAHQAHWGQTGLKVGEARAELKAMVQACREFVKTCASQGEAYDAALAGLQLFEQGKVNARMPDALTLGVNRRYLSEFIQQLNRRDIVQTARANVALELFRSLGCCPEGENLRLEESIRELKHYGQGLDKRFATLKESQIDQVLQKLVFQEYAHWQPNYEKLEIHHINALKNLYCNEWGLEYKTDRHSHVSVQRDLGEMAWELVAKTVTEASVFQRITEQVRDTCLNSLGAADTHTAEGEAYLYNNGGKVKIDVLASHLKSNFGNQLTLHDVLEISDDASTFRLKTDAEIGAAVLVKLQSKSHLLAHPAGSEAEKQSSAAALLAERPHNADTVLGQMRQRMKNNGLLTPGELRMRHHISGQISSYLQIIDIHQDPRKKHEDADSIKDASYPIAHQTPGPEPKSTGLGSKNPGGSEQAQ